MTKTTFVLGTLVGLLVAPAMLLAQESQTDLRTAIQSSVLSDPRTANIPPAQLMALVDALVSEAEAQHMSASDILWQPENPTTSNAAASVGTAGTGCPKGIMGYACEFNAAFGFEGGGYEIPILMLITSGFLVFIVWELILHHRKKLAVKKSRNAPPWEGMS